MRHIRSSRSPLLRTSLAVFFVVATSACGSSVEPNVPANIERTGDEQLGTINAPLDAPIAVRVTDSRSIPLSGVSLTWTVTGGGGSVSPSSSTTDADGSAQAVWTLGPTPGQQAVTVAVAGFDVAATFSATALTFAVCGTTINLPPNGICLASPGRAADVQVAGGSSGAEYTAIPYFDGNVGRTAFPVSAIAAGGTAVTGPPSPTMLPSAVLGVLSDGAIPVRDIAFETALRRRERELLRSGVTAGPSSGARHTIMTEPSAPRMLTVGQTLTLNTNPRAGQECQIIDQYIKQAQVRAVSANAAIVEDTQNPVSFTAADYDEILGNLENLIRPMAIEAFGAHTDIDNNQKVIIFYTVEVNRLPAASAPFFVGGYFHSRDLRPKSGSVTTPTNKTLTECRGSNAGELFYMAAPDPAGTVGTARTTAFVKRATAAALAHEYAHLINASRRLYITPGAQATEDVWLDEGFAHIAEELAYYRATGLSPRQNLNRDAIMSTPARVNLLDTYQRANLSRYAQYLQKTNTQSPYGENPTDTTLDDVETRGAIWSFLRWAADHRGSSDGDVWHRLVRDATASGADNLRAVFGSDIGGRFREWAAASYIDDGVPVGNATFAHPSWNFRSVLPAIVSGNFPLQTFSIGGATANFTLLDGSAAYLRFGVAANATATVRITSSGGTMPSGASVWFVRTK